MSSEIAKIASADPPDQIEIDYDLRLRTDHPDFVIFIARQELQPLAPWRALHPRLRTQPVELILASVTLMRKSHAVSILLLISICAITREPLQCKYLSV